MIDIGRLRLQLPAGFERRAPRIARLVGDALSRHVVSGQHQLDRLKIGPLYLDQGQSDHQVAERIAGAIIARLPTG